jgi:altronate dehydratase
MDAGMLMHEDPHTVLERLALLLQEVASGRSKTRNELNRNRSIAILKDGVTL